MLFGVMSYVLSAQTADSLKTDSLKAVHLNEVEVTATSNPNKSLLSQPTSIVKLNETELKRSASLYLDDAINANIPGVFMERRTISAGQQINIRGYGNGVGFRGASNNFDSQGLKMYLNGIPITDAEGITVMDDIDFGSIGNVEVVKGPAGTLYGLAVAGAVNLQTKKAEKGKISVGQDVMLGSYGLRRLTTRIEIGGQNSSLLVNYGRQQSDGFIAHTASQKDFVNVIGDFHPNNKQSVTTYVGYSNSYDERQGELTIGQWDTLNYSGNPAYIKNNAHSNVVSVRAGVGHTYKFNKYISHSFSVFGTGTSNNASSAGGWTDKNAVNYGARTTFDMHFDLNEKFHLNGITGGEIQQQIAQTVGYGMTAPNLPSYTYNIIGSVKSNQFTRCETSSLFSEWTLVMPKDLSVTAGLGLSTMLITLNDRVYVTGATKNPTYSKGYDHLFSPHFAVNKIFSKKLSVYASYSTGYKAPTSSIFFIPTTGQINSGLVPEKGTQIEIGTKGDLLKEKLHYEVAIFSAQFTNKMTSIAVPLAPPLVGTAYTYIANRGGQDDKGVEALVKYLVYKSEGFVKDIRIFTNFCYSNFKYTNYAYQTLSPDKKSAVITDYSGNAVAGVAPITANAGIDVSTKIGVYANVNYMYRDAMPFTSDGLNTTHPYGLLNSKLGIRYVIAKHFDIDLFMGAVNMTNTQYAYMVFVNQLPDAYIPAPNKINYFGGINFKYIF